MVLLSVKQVAELFSVTDMTVYTWMKNKKIPFLSVGGVVRFDKDELLVAARTGGKNK